MVSKIIKTFQKTLKTARLGRRARQDLRGPVELAYTPEVSSGGQDMAPSPPPLKMPRLELPETPGKLGETEGPGASPPAGAGLNHGRGRAG